MENISRVVFAIDNLIDVNGERLILYKKLADESKDRELKFLFLEYAIQAQTFTATLNKWRHAYGAPSYYGKKPGFFNTAYNQVKKAILSENKLSTLRECELLENTAIKKYKTATALSFLPTAAANDIARQTDALEKSYYTLKTHREADGMQQMQAAFV